MIDLTLFWVVLNKIDEPLDVILVIMGAYFDLGLLGDLKYRFQWTTLYKFCCLTTGGHYGTHSGDISLDGEWEWGSEVMFGFTTSEGFFADT